MTTVKGSISSMSVSIMLEEPIVGFTHVMQTIFLRQSSTVTYDNYTVRSP